MVEQLLGADDDWQESLRRWLYPKIHPQTGSRFAYHVLLKLVRRLDIDGRLRE